MSTAMHIGTVTCSSDLFVKIWDAQNDWKNTKTFPGHEHTVSSVRFMPGDQQVVSASRDRSIRIFDVASTYVLFTYTLSNPDSEDIDIWCALSQGTLTGCAALYRRTTVK